MAFGIRSTNHLITSAALIMMVVFAGFSSGRLVMLQQMGFNLAVAMIMDATIILIVLVPASMKLLGKTNWWLPSRLNWLPDLRVEPATSSKPAREPKMSAGPIPSDASSELAKTQTVARLMPGLFLS